MNTESFTEYELTQEINKIENELDWYLINQDLVYQESKEITYLDYSH